jgi:hypothetical protein
MQHSWGDDKYVMILIRKLKGINYFTDLNVDGSTVLTPTSNGY